MSNRKHSLHNWESTWCIFKNKDQTFSTVTLKLPTGALTYIDTTTYKHDSVQPLNHFAL